MRQTKIVTLALTEDTPQGNALPIALAEENPGFRW